MNSTQQLAGLTIVKYDGGEMAATPDNHTPDLAFFEPSLPEKTRPNRAPGVIKSSLKWSLELRNHPTAGIRSEFRQALSQVNWYMWQHNA
jgi:hypothetical protein